MSTLIDIADFVDTAKRAEIAEYINSHESEFDTFLDRLFEKSSDDANRAKLELLVLVDLLNRRIAINVIERALEKKDLMIKVRALQAAYRTRVDSLNEKLLPLLENSSTDFEVKKWIIHILASTDPNAYGKTLRNISRDQDECVELRREAIFALTNVDDDRCLGTLCAILGDSNVRIRQAGAWALSKIQSSDTINCLLASLEDGDSAVRDWSIRGLRDMDDIRALQGLADALTFAEPVEQVRIIRLIIEKRSEIILRAVAELLSSQDVAVRRVAAWAMGVSPYPPAKQSLEELIKDDDQDVRFYANAALRRLGMTDSSDIGFFL